MTHTFAELAVTDTVYNEIRMKLKDAGYDHAFIPSREHPEGSEAIDMHGIALVREEKPERPVPPAGRILREGEQPKAEPRVGFFWTGVRKWSEWWCGVFGA